MNDDRLEALLSAYAAGTLTEAEREDLFALAMERQDLFDRLLNEEPVREALDHPATRQRLIHVLESSSRPGRFAFRKSPGWALAGVLAVLIAGAVLLRVPFQEPPAPRVMQPPQFSARSAPPVSQQAYSPEPTPVTVPSRVPGPARRTGKSARESVQPTAQAEQPASAPHNVRLRGGVNSAVGSLDSSSPRTVYQLHQARLSAGALPGEGARAAAPFESGAIARIAPRSSDLLQKTALRVSFHAPASADELDWRSGVPLGSFVRISLTSSAYVAVIEHGPGGKRLVLSPGDKLRQTGEPFDVPLGDSSGAFELSLIYSVTPLTAESVDTFPNSPAASVEQSHSPAEHAAYAAAPSSTPVFVLTLPIRVSQ